VLRTGLTPWAVQLPLADHVQGLDSSDEDSSTPKRLESEHRLGDSFDCSVALLDDVVEVLVLAHQNVDTSKILIARRCTVQWSTKTPRSCIISSTLRKLNG
jgi:hypothetical protein